MHSTTSTFAVAAYALLATAPLALAQEDCDIAAKFMPFATVDCSYVWENSNSNNFLNYVVKISGTGQRQAGWCKGILDNVFGKCRVPRNSISMHACNENSEETFTIGYDEPSNESIEMYGIEMNFHMDKWTAGEDNRLCVTEAIREATCSTVSLDEYACYQR